MINLETEKQKAPTRVLEDIAKENNLAVIVIGNHNDGITEQEFNKVIWFPRNKEFVSLNEKSLPSPISWIAYKQRLDEYLLKLEYTYNRKSEYPRIEEQLDIIFHKGIDVWKEQIQAVKDKYPKPE
jgi:tRNA C32,U32 (ribose-2'-O)-methylase TrmJ